MIRFDKNYLDNLENNKSLKENYAKLGAYSQNKIIYLPTILIILSLMILYFLYDSNMLISKYGGVTFGVTAISILSVILILRHSKKKILSNLDSVKIAIAKKVLGNDRAELYYIIYTQGEERHNPDFINAIAERVFNVDTLNDIDTKTKKKIKKMFGERPNFSGFEKLPLEFTLGKDVFLMVQNFAILNTDMKTIIKNNNDTYPVVVFSSNQAVMIGNKNL